MALVDTVIDDPGGAVVNRKARRSAAAKRAMDIVLGVPLCLAVSPVVVLLALILAVQLRCNPFFVHQRLGHGGRVLTIPKLRTLPRNTHPYADKTRSALEPPTRLAATLRRLHVDELPQLYLVPLGRLSLVGPRPRMAQEAEDHDDPEFDRIRTAVRQGCTGLWQVSADKVGRVSDAPQYDLLYVEQRTIWLDCWILWRTFVQTLGASPITLEDIPTWVLRGDVQQACRVA